MGQANFLSFLTNVWCVPRRFPCYTNLQRVACRHKWKVDSRKICGRNWSVRESSVVKFRCQVLPWSSPSEMWRAHVFVLFRCANFFKYLRLLLPVCSCILVTWSLWTSRGDLCTSGSVELTQFFCWEVEVVPLPCIISCHSFSNPPAAISALTWKNKKSLSMNRINYAAQ